MQTFHDYCEVYLVEAFHNQIRQYALQSLEPKITSPCEAALNSVHYFTLRSSNP